MWKTLVVRYNPTSSYFKKWKTETLHPEWQINTTDGCGFLNERKFFYHHHKLAKLQKSIKKTTTTLLLQLTTSLPGSWIFNETVFHLGEISTWSLWFWIHHVCGFRRFHTLLITFWAKSSAQNYFHKIMHFPQKIVRHWKGILFECNIVCNSKVNKV